MKRILLIILLNFSFLYSEIKEGNIRFGLGGGANISNMILKDDYGILHIEGIKPRVGLNAGIFGEYGLLNNTSIEGGVYYSQQDFVIHGRDKYYYDMDYINFTFGAKYYLLEYVSFGIMPTIGFNFRAERDAHGLKENMHKVVIEGKEYDVFNYINFSVGLQLAFNYEFFEIGVRHSFGVNNLFKSSEEEFFGKYFPSSLRESTTLVYAKYIILEF